MGPYGVDVSERRAVLSKVLLKQDCQQHGILLVDKGSHTLLNHAIRRSQKILTAHDLAQVL